MKLPWLCQECGRSNYHYGSCDCEEIEQLRSDLALRDETARARKEIIGKLEPEVERLTRRLALAEKTIECFEADRVEFEAEIERLRAALHWTAQHCLDAKCARRAMDALEGEKNATVTIHGDCGMEHPSIEDWQRCPVCTKILRERTSPAITKAEGRAVEQKAPENKR